MSENLNAEEILNEIDEEAELLEQLEISYAQELHDLERLALMTHRAAELEVDPSPEAQAEFVKVLEEMDELAGLMASKS